MRVRAGGQQKRHATMRGVGQVGLQLPARRDRLRATRQFPDLCDKRKVAHKFAAAAEIACGRHVNDIGTRFSQVLFGGFQKLGRPVHMAAALRLALNLDAAQNPVLQ